MCGIVGAWNRSLDEEAKTAALSAIAHRGPDDHGELRDKDEGVFLGHTRLTIIDLSDAGAQPMHSDDDRLVLIFNGEIYNYRELREELIQRGAKFRGHSDTEVLLRLYEAEGLAMLPRLNGIFAFALYDRRSQEMLLARDALGVKPLYYADEGEDGGGFAFASEIKALLPLTQATPELDLPALQRYLTYLWCPGEGTPLVGVRKLGPGELLRVRDGRIVERKSWYRLPILNRPAKSMTADDAIAAVREGLRRAVHRQLVADVPVGAFLSGGLDSSAIVAFAREQTPDLRCFSIETVGEQDSGTTDDLPYARRVAAHLGVGLDVVRIEASQMVRDIEEMVWRLDEPLADPAPLNALYISRLARESGMKVLLSGVGGDDLFTGYRRHLALRYEPLWSWLPRGARAGIERMVGKLDQRSSLGRRLSRLFSGAEKTGDERLAAYFAWAQRADLEPLYSDAFRAAVRDSRAEEPMLELLSGMSADRGPIDRMLALEQRFFLSDHNLIYTDKMSMAAGVEVRVPFLDLELVELASRIPDRFKQRRSESKWVLKKAMEPFLPRDVIYRPKTGFGAPLRQWMHGELREMALDLLGEESLRRRGLFEPRGVQRLIEDDAAGRRDAAYTLFSLMCIEIWCRRFGVLG